MGVRRIVSGGQTGADRGALDAAIELGIDHGGYCPAGRRAEDGRIPGRYRLVETESANYAQRTLENVLESEGTLIVTRGPARSRGTALTAALAVRHRRPLLHIDLAASAGTRDREAHAARIREWLDASGVQILNVAGPRESGCPGIAQEVRELLKRALSSGGG